MGSILFSSADFFDSTSEIVGIKSGLLLNNHSIAQILREDFNDPFLKHPSESTLIRIRSEEVENMIKYIRIRIGNLPEKSKIDYYKIFRKYAKEAHFMIIQDWLNFAMREELEGKAITHEILLTSIKKKTDLPDELTLALVHFIIERLDDSVVPSLKQSENLDNSARLEDLFHCEIHAKDKNTFIDQKFIDYLAANSHEIELIHWRNFEKLCAEYFRKKGFVVQLGPGSNDGGIDIRVFHETNKNAPFILIQCKRYAKEKKVTIETVKAFHSDVMFEKAKMGLIATTGHIAPGGKKVVGARNYNISFAEKERIKNWAKSMWTHK